MSLEWVAGLLEGEGYFGTVTTGRQTYAVIQCNMTDLDVLRRLQEATGLGRINGPYTGARTRHPHYAWKAYGTQARALMRELLPLMGARRAARIREVLELDTHRPFTEYRPAYLAQRGL